MFHHLLKEKNKLLPLLFVEMAGIALILKWWKTGKKEIVDVKIIEFRVSSGFF